LRRGLRQSPDDPDEQRSRPLEDSTHDQVKLTALFRTSPFPPSFKFSLDA
jgi:hypothetical protein